MKRYWVVIGVLVLLAAMVMPGSAFARSLDQENTETPTPSPTPTLTPTPSYLVALQYSETDTLLIEKSVTLGDIFVVSAIAALIVVIIIVANLIISRFLPAAS